MIGIVDIGMCNLRSISKAVDGLGFDFVWLKAPEDVARVSHCILPGVGNFRTASERLVEQGLRDAIRSHAVAGKPVLGVCLGMQLLADEGDEGGGAVGLGLVPGRVERLNPPNGLRVPHIGWNTVRLQAKHPLFQGIKPERDFYFVHSYALCARDRASVLGETDYGNWFTSVVARANVVGTQFHPEKSQANGLRFLESFCQWDGRC